METNMLIFIVIGIIGGIYHTLNDINRNYKSQKAFYNTKILIQNILISSAATFMVPLFLYMFGSKFFIHIETLESFSYNFYIIISFTIIASLSSRIIFSRVL